MSGWGPVRAPGFTVLVLNTCTLFIHKCISEMCGLSGQSDTSINICKCIDVIGFTEDIFDTMLSPLTSLHKWCQVSIGIGICLVSVRCQVTTLTNAALSPKGDPGKRSDMIGLTPEAEIKWRTFSRATFSNAFSGMKMSIFRLIFHGILFLKVKLTTNHHWFT